jgi:antitoxin MazE
MRIAVRKWGNSLAFRIPKALAADTRLESGSEVDVAVEAGCLVVTPVAAGPSLGELLDRVTEQNTHGEVDTGARVGREVW